MILDLRKTNFSIRFNIENIHYEINNHFPGENIGNKISKSQIRIEFL